MKLSVHSRRTFLKAAGLTTATAALPGCFPAGRPVSVPQPVNMAYPRPNILWLSTEDIGPQLGCYGDPNAKTPMLDRLAAEGIRYENAFVVTGVCAPTRSSVITGMYPTTLGTHHMRAGGEGADRSIKPKLPSYVRCFSEYLRQIGYYCTNNSKQDYNFDAPDSAWDESSGKAHWKNRPKTTPFFAVFNYTGTHEGSIRLDDADHAKRIARLTEDHRQDPQKLTPPPYYPDTPVVRKQWAKYYELITAMDYWIADHIKELEEANLAEDTIVFFWSDHGVGMPRAKRWCYDSGTHIPLMVRIPPRFRVGTQGIPGTVEEELVSSVDLAPTVLNLAGFPIPNHIQGRPFLGPNLPARRQYAFSARDRMDERYDMIRSVRDRRFRYIRNYEPFKPYYQYVQSAERGPVMQELRKEHLAGRLNTAAEKFMTQSKPLEELYDIKEDPYELNNVAENISYADVLRRMRGAHVRWMLETRDLGLIPEPELVWGEQQYGTRYEMGLASDDEQERRTLFYVAAVAGRPSIMNLTKLADALHNEYPAVRYWGAIGLGNIGSEAEPSVDFLLAAVQDSSPFVCVAAARALWKLGRTDQALAILTEKLQSPLEWIRLHAALVLDEMGPEAQPAIPVLQQALQDRHNKYVVRVANHALNKLLGTKNRVP
ncbi:MAG: sulfatase-like hydrolase/transferase [Sedimentisphaerales bacterium]|nr:sulfatase-like hydrolase/transferase [Sedimentisphaerales bacterium]